jgi:hypothetical protein
MRSQRCPRGEADRHGRARLLSRVSLRCRAPQLQLAVAQVVTERILNTPEDRYE